MSSTAYLGSLARKFFLMSGMKPPPQSICPDSIAWSAVLLPVKVRKRIVFTFGMPGW